MEAAGATLCFIGGILAGLIGGILTGTSWILGAAQHPWVQWFGTALLITTIPLLILAGYCLDWMERDWKKPFPPSQNKGERGSSPLYEILAAAIILIVVILVPLEVRAQQTIFNVPSSDVLDQGNVYLELDVTFKPNNDIGSVVQRFSSFVPRVVVGTGERVELGLNIARNINPGPDATALVPAIKWKAYDGGDNGWAIVLGDNCFFPVRNKSYNVGNYGYVQASKIFNGKTRITFGGYHFSRNVVAAGAQRAGGQFGFEQPINSKFGFAVDWYTGKHAAGYLTPGFNFKPHPKLTGYLGYSIGNSSPSNGNHFFYTAVGFTLN